jgi:hypothetical protein
MERRKQTLYGPLTPRVTASLLRAPIFINSSRAIWIESRNITILAGRKVHLLQLQDGTALSVGVESSNHSCTRRARLEFVKRKIVGIGDGERQRLAECQAEQERMDAELQAKAQEEGTACPLCEFPLLRRCAMPNQKREPQAQQAFRRPLRRSRTTTNGGLARSAVNYGRVVAGRLARER